MIVKRKLFSSISEKIFGEVKRANKAAKRAELKKLGADKIVPQKQINLFRELILWDKPTPTSDANVEEMVKIREARSKSRKGSIFLGLGDGNRGFERKISFDPLTKNGSKQFRKDKLAQYKIDKALKKAHEESLNALRWKNLAKSLHLQKRW